MRDLSAEQICFQYTASRLFRSRGGVCILVKNNRPAAAYRVFLSASEKSDQTIYFIYSHSKNTAGRRTMFRM